MTTLADLERQAQVQKQPTLDPQTNKYVNAPSMIMNQKILEELNVFMAGKSKIVQIDVDAIEDSQWVAESLYSDGHKLSGDALNRRFWSTSDRKFEDTSLGGNYVCNPRPGFTPWADPPKPGLIAQRDTLSPLANLSNIGMGTFYSEVHDDNYQVLDLRFGKPEYNSLQGFLWSSFSAKDALLANTGSYSPVFFTLGQAAGLGGLFLLLGPLASITILSVSYIGGFINGILSTNPHKFYYIRPTMFLYWRSVSNILNNILSYKGLYTGNNSDPTQVNAIENRGADLTILEEVQAIMPGVFDSSGAVNARRIVNRAERINQEVIKLQTAAAERLTSYEALRSEIAVLSKSINKDYPGMSEEDALKMYMGALDIEEGADKEKTNFNTLLMGTAEDRFADGQGEALSTANKAQERLGGTTESASDVESKISSTYAKSVGEKVKGKAKKLGEYFSAEMSDGSAFASFRVDHTGPASETFSNSSMKNDLGEKFNSLSASGRAASFTFAGGNIAAGMNEVMGAMKSMVAGVMSAVKLDGLLSLAGAAYVDVPEGWENAAYSGAGQSMNYSMRLISPSAHPMAQLQHIYLPMAMLIAGVVPHAAGRASYTMPFLCEAYDRGRGIARTAMISQVLFSRGTSNLGFNQTKDMLAVDVQFTIKDLSSCLYMPLEMGGGLNPADSIHTYDSTYSDYIATLGSATTGQSIYKGQKLRIRYRQWKRGNLSQITTVDHWAGLFRDLPGVRDLDFLWPDSGRGN